jgi:HlyD family secretion protein
MASRYPRSAPPVVVVGERGPRRARDPPGSATPAGFPDSRYAVRCSEIIGEFVGAAIAECRGMNRTTWKRAGFALGIAVVIGAVAWSKTKPRAAVAVPVERGRAVEAVYATGTVEAEERRIVKARAGGLLVELRVREGDAVKAGELLGRIDLPTAAAEVRQRRVEAGAARALAADAGPRLAALRAQEAALEAELAQAKADRDRALALAQSAAAPRTEAERLVSRVAQIEAQLAARRAEERALAIALRASTDRSAASLDAAQARLADSELRAPIDGVVLARLVEPGEVVGKDQPVLKIGDVRGLILEVLVDESDVARVSDGGDGRPPSPVVASLYAMPKRTLHGTVARVLPDAQRDKKAFLVKVRLADAPPGLRSGMSAEVNIVTQTREGVLVAPTEALRADGTAWVLRDGRAVRVAVTRGIGDLLRTEVRSGLAAGDLVVVDGGDALVEGARVQAKISRADREAPVPRTDEVAKTSF